MTTSPIPSTGIPPNDWDLYPPIYREYLDGGDIKAPTPESIAENRARLANDHQHQQQRTQEPSDNADLHPLLWRKLVSKESEQA